MFTKRTIKPERRVTSVDTPSEALAVVDFVLPFGYTEEKAMKGEQHEHHSQYLLFRQKRTITVYSGVDIYIDDAKLDARDANGNPVETFVYNGTTYLPVRAVGEAVGKAVQWESKTSSVYIGQHKSDKPAVWLDEPAAGKKCCAQQQTQRHAKETFEFDVHISSPFPPESGNHDTGEINSRLKYSLPFMISSLIFSS